MPLTIHSIGGQINSTSSKDEKWTLESFAKIINSIDPKNAALAFPKSLKHYEREEALPSQTEIVGRFVSLIWHSHWPRLDLEVHESERDLADSADRWLDQADNYWAFRDDVLIDCKRVSCGKLNGYNVHLSACKNFIAIGDGKRLG
jgi:hypothetical protein